jgi:hypothetical protein
MCKKHGELIDHILAGTELARRNVSLEIDATQARTSPCHSDSVSPDGAGLTLDSSTTRTHRPLPRPALTVRVFV